jgi:hypothetical protein
VCRGPAIALWFYVVVYLLRGSKRTIAARTFQDGPTLIFASASSTVNEFGFWIAGNCLNVSANLPAHCDRSEGVYAHRPRYFVPRE